MSKRSRSSRQQPAKPSARRAQIESGQARKGKVIVANNQPFSNESNKKIRQVPIPNIQDLARRGGLIEPGAVPYKLDEYDGELYMSASAVGTPTVNQYVILGLAQEIGDARHFCLHVETKATPDLIAARFPNLAFAGPKWGRQKIIERRSAGNHLETAHELYEVLTAKAPQVRAWPPPGHDNRPSRVQQGEVACRLLAELKHINKACKRDQLQLDELRQRFSSFAIWRLEQRLNPARKKDFQRLLADRGSWKANNLYETVAILMCAGSYATVKDWCKEFRRWQRST